MKLEHELNAASEFMMLLDKKLIGLRLKENTSAKVSGALLHLSLEHFGSIVILLKNNLSASAAALLRLQYEALIRAMYFYQCATDDEASKFYTGKEPPRIKDMISALEKKQEFISGILTNVHEMKWRSMNSFTHGGSAQIKRRFSSSDLQNNFTEDDCLNILKEAKTIALLSASYAAISCGSVEIANELNNEFRNVSVEL